MDELERHLLPCFYKKYFGVDCPGCGMQRSMIALLEGNLLESFQLFPALLPMLVMLGFLSLHLVFKFEKGGTWLKYMFIGVAAIVTINYVLKMVAHVGMQ